MVHIELTARLNDSGYKNWLKAGFCLLKLRDGLHSFTNNEMKSFHGKLLNVNPVLRQSCRRECRPKNNQLHTECEVCAAWQSMILKHHRGGMVNWGNCSPPLWSREHWELAKAYMPRGQAGDKMADQCDASALLNLLNFCDHFSFVDPKWVREVIQCRNETMHSSQMQLSDEWMRKYQRSLERFLQELRHVPELASASQHIQQALTADWSVSVAGVDRVDTAGEDGVESDAGSQWEMEIDSLSQWEVELLRERLQELQSDSDSQDTEELLNMRAFLQASSDLTEQFSPELQALASLGRKRKRGEDDEKEGGR